MFYTFNLQIPSQRQPLTQRNFNRTPKHVHTQFFTNQNQIPSKLASPNANLSNYPIRQCLFKIKDSDQTQIQKLKAIISDKDKILIQKQQEIRNLRLMLKQSQNKINELSEMIETLPKLNLVTSFSSIKDDLTGRTLETITKSKSQLQENQNDSFNNLNLRLKNVENILLQLQNLTQEKIYLHLNISKNYPANRLTSSQELKSKKTPRIKNQSLFKCQSKRSFQGYIHSSPTDTIYSQSEDTQQFIHRAIAQHRLIKQSIQKMQEQSDKQLYKLKEYYQGIVFSCNKEIDEHKKKQEQLKKLILILKEQKNESEQRRNQSKLQ